MIPVSQTRYGGPLDAPDTQGECFAACVASILELPLNEVPNPHGSDWYERWQDWLAPRNLRLVTIPYQKPDGQGTAMPEGDWPGGYMAWIVPAGASA